MRFLSTILLSLCCLAGSFNSNRVDVNVKATQATNEYRAIEQALPNDALNDYHHISALQNTVVSSSFQKENASYYNSNAESDRLYILNNSFQKKLVAFSGNHAKAFRKKLIFPQHYYW